MLCTKCGTRIPKGACSCAICGTRVESSTQTASSVDTSSSTNAESVSIVEAALNATASVKSYTPIEPIAAPVAESDAGPGIQPTPPVKKTKKKKSLALLLVCCLILVAAAAIAVFSLPNKETVYLVTEHVTESANGAVTTYRYEYDSEGRIVKHEYQHDYPVEFSGFSAKYEIAYAYNSKGNLTRAEFASDGEAITIHYLYENGKLTGIESKDLLDEANIDKLNVSCDSEGRLTHIGYPGENGTERAYWDFTYHDSGTIKQSTYCQAYDFSVSSYLSSSLYSYGEFKNITVYDQNGNIVETIQNHDGDELTRSVYAYNSRGQITNQESYYRGKLQYRLELDYSYNMGQLDGLTMGYQTILNTQPLEVKMTFNCDWDGRNCTLTVDEITCDAEMLKNLDIDKFDIRITFEVDDAGNLLSWARYSGDKLQESHSYKYQAFEVPGDYRKPDLNTDPLYLYFLLTP